MASIAIPEIRTLKDGRKIVRRKARDPVSGNEFFQYQLENNREVVGSSVSLYGGESYRAGPGEEYQRFERACRPGSAIALTPYDPLGIEIDKLSREFPELAKWVDGRREKAEREVDPESLFNVGDVVRVSSVTTGLLKIERDELLGFLARHRRGEFGLNGTYRELDDDSDERWASPYFDVSVRNSNSIADQSGLIQSKYSCFKADDATRRRNEGSYVLVTTLLCPGRAQQTAITCSLDVI